VTAAKLLPRKGYEVKKWQAERAKYSKVAPKPVGMK
jgi:hypothetical protein